MLNPRNSQTSNRSTISQFSKSNWRYSQLRSGVFDFQNAPVFSIFLLLVVVLNLGMLILSLLATRLPDANVVKILADPNKKELYPLFFTANNRSAIYFGYQFWRFFLYAFTEDSTGFYILISALFVFLTFFRIGYQVEICLGSWRTALLLIGGILIVGLMHFVTSHFNRLYFYGTEYLSFLCLGAIFFFWTTKISNSEQLNLQLRNLFFLVLILTIVFTVLRYVQTAKFSSDRQPLGQELTLLRDWAFLGPFLTFAVGYFLTTLMFWRSFQSKLLIWTAVIFILTLSVVIVAMLIYLLSQDKISISNEPWNSEIRAIYQY